MAGPPKWDEYGAMCREAGQLAMEVFVCFTTPVQPGPPPTEVMAEHKAYIASLEEDGRVFLAGPLSNAEATHLSGGGMLVFRADDLEAAKAIADGDPMHREGIRTYKMQAWRLNEGAPLPGSRLSKGIFGT